MKFFKTKQQILKIVNLAELRYLELVHVGNLVELNCLPYLEHLEIKKNAFSFKSGIKKSIYYSNTDEEKIEDLDIDKLELTKNVTSIVLYPSLSFPLKSLQQPCLALLNLHLYKTRVAFSGIELLLNKYLSNLRVLAI